MNLRPLLLLATLAVAVACNNNSPLNDPAALLKPNAIEFVKVTVKDSSAVPEVQGEWNRVDLQWLEIQPADNPVGKQINGAIRLRILELLASITAEDPTLSQSMPTDMQKASRSFVETARSSQIEFQESMGWYLETHMDTVYHTKNLLSYVFNTDTYTGGAHGFHGTYFLHFDPRDGKEVQMDQFFRDPAALSAALEKSFRKERGLSSNQSLLDGGLFEDLSGHFPITSEMHFDHQGLIAVYNPYEIAPYSEGAIVIRLNDEELTPLLSLPRRP